MKNSESEYRNSEQIFNGGERSEVKVQMPKECQIPNEDSEIEDPELGSRPGLE